MTFDNILSSFTLNLQNKALIKFSKNDNSRKYVLVKSAKKPLPKLRYPKTYLLKVYSSLGFFPFWDNFFMILPAWVAKSRREEMFVEIWQVY